MFFPVLLNRDSDQFLLLISRRFGIVFILVYCPGEANLHTVTAIDAFERVISYLSLFETYFYGIGRTDPGTIAT
jgi:hypothetical protein